MKIYKYDVPNKLIERYCKVIILLEKRFDPNLEKVRKEIHNELFDITGCYRDLHRREDREFNKALNEVVIDLTFDEGNVY